MELSLRMHILYIPTARLVPLPYDNYVACYLLIRPRNTELYKSEIIANFIDKYYTNIHTINHFIIDVQK